jgi:hypothetical protein
MWEFDKLTYHYFELVNKIHLLPTPWIGSPPWEANSHSASQEITSLPEGSFPFSQQSITGPYPELNESSP